MFSGIVEEAARVVALRKDGGNLHITLKCSFTDELKIDQSVSHNGVCLTVVELPGDGTYTVTAIQETLDRSNLGLLKVGDEVNVERSMLIEGRLDGHVCNSERDSFQVAIIPYTREITNFHCIELGTVVNLEFDIIGKYLARLMEFAL